MHDARDEKVTAAARAQLARAWLELERLKREIRMKPKPKPIDVAPRLPKSRRSSGYSDPFEHPKTPRENIAQRKTAEPAVASTAETPTNPSAQPREASEQPNQETDDAKG